MRIFPALSLALLVAPVGAQVLTDHFNYPDGGVVPNWTQQRGTWQVLSGRLSATSGGTWAYITRDGTSATNSVLDGTFYYSAASSVQFGGFTARHPGGSADANLLMTKIQNNGGAADFDRCFAYERVFGSSTYADIPGGTLSAHCRMVTLDNEFWMEVDADMDGLFEFALPPKTITNIFSAGFVGMTAYQTTEMDDFEYFDAVLLPQVGAAPRLGSSYGLRLATPSPSVPWLGMLSGGNAGFPIDATRSIPLTLDGILNATIGSAGLGLIGVTDPNGNVTTAIPIPQDPTLVGLRLYVGAVTIDQNQPLGVGHISNELAFEIVP